MELNGSYAELVKLQGGTNQTEDQNPSQITKKKENESKSKVIIRLLRI
jgi:hypothetical protein